MNFRMGWRDRVLARGFNKSYDTWPEKNQRDYEWGRRAAALVQGVPEYHKHVRPVELYNTPVSALPLAAMIDVRDEKLGVRRHVG